MFQFELGGVVGMPRTAERLVHVRLGCAIWAQLLELDAQSIKFLLANCCSLWYVETHIDEGLLGLGMGKECPTCFRIVGMMVAPGLASSMVAWVTPKINCSEFICHLTLY